RAPGASKTAGSAGGFTAAEPGPVGVPQAARLRTAAAASPRSAPRVACIERDRPGRASVRGVLADVAHGVRVHGVPGEAIGGTLAQDHAWPHPGAREDQPPAARVDVGLVPEPIRAAE